MIESKPSCADSSHLSVEQALALLTANLQAIAGYERVQLYQAVNRVLAQDIISPMHVPSYTNAAMDGYALHSSDLATGSAEIIDKVLAGHPSTKSLNSGQCVRIMTGGLLPIGADTVIMQEHVELQGKKILFNPAQHKAGQNVRLAGEDIALGQTILTAGKQLLAPELGLLASLGIAEISVKPKLKVGLFSTGDELVPLGQPLKPGQIYDSNRYQLYAALHRLQVEIIDLGLVPDQASQIEQAFINASKIVDVLITSGGVSVGEADYVKPILEKLGQINFWKIAMKPGHPLTFGKFNDTLFFGLPGNPVSSLVTFYQFVQPSMQILSGLKHVQSWHWKVRCASRFKKKAGRTEFQRGFLSYQNDEWVVSSTGAQGSHIIRSMVEANCFIILPAAQTTVNEGDYVTVQPFAGLL